jgi:hypothetical protein
MGLYSHLADAELLALRTRYMDALTERLTGPSHVAASGKSVSFNNRTVEYQRAIEDLRKELKAINAELQARGLAPTTGTAKPRQPIYLVG